MKKSEEHELEEEIDYFKEILTDMLKERCPCIKMSDNEIDRRATQATKLLLRDDLTTNQLIEYAMSILEKDLYAPNLYVS